MKLVKVRGQLTLEEIDAGITVTEDQFPDLASIPPRNDEKSYYTSIESDLDAILAPDYKGTSRQLIVQNHECISTIQVLLDRGPFSTMLVYFRSSSAERIASDLGFLARMAIKANVRRIICHMGSFHVILTEDRQ